eukprot:1476113-Pleurochrysis_carterae.AAC.1
MDFTVRKSDHIHSSNPKSVSYTTHRTNVASRTLTQNLEPVVIWSRCMFGTLWLLYTWPL